MPALRARHARHIERVHEKYIFPDAHAHGRGERPEVLYTVGFEATELWGKGAEGRGRVYVDLWESYLEPAGAGADGSDEKAAAAATRHPQAQGQATMSDAHDHDHDGGHHPRPLSPIEARVRAVESLLLEKGLVSSDAIDRVVSAYEKDIGPLNGARAVARAWRDPQFKKRLLDDATAALRELGIGGLQGEHMVAVENTAKVHNVVVCTLCSCYPWPVLGLPPAWYKSAPYRSRMVKEPRSVLDEFGVKLDPSVEVRVWDSSAEIRYLVLPMRPKGSEGLGEEELARLVTRDSMIGVATVVPSR